MKSILFKPEMVRPTLAGQKTMMRQIVKFPPGLHGWYRVENPLGIAWVGGIKRPSYQIGDVLYVRETWSTQQDSQCKGMETGNCPYESCSTAKGSCFGREFIYKATNILPDGEKWYPSTQMPKEAARIFLRVTGIRAERLWNISMLDVRKEGTPQMPGNKDKSVGEEDFAYFWDSTVKSSDKDRYSWAANPWVWVLEFKKN